MIYRHKRTKVLYRIVTESFDVSRQEKHIVYISLETGEMFNRSLEVFNQNFEFIRDPQPDIIAKDPKPETIQTKA